MNPGKRQLSLSRIPAHKKRRSKCDNLKKLCSDDRFDLGNTSFEDVSNELLYEVFDYLDGCDIYQAFGGLNNRFDNLLSDPSLLLKINLSSELETKLHGLCRDVILPNRHRLRSLELSRDSLIETFFTYCSIDSSFTSLQSVVLNDISNPHVLAILSYLSCLPCLSSLTIRLEEDYFYNLSYIYRLIFRCPHLNYCKLSTLDYEEHEIVVPRSINQRPSSIERLIINHPCTIEELTSLLLHLPSLRYLSCDQLIGSDEDQMNKRNEQLILPQLIQISITSCFVAFDDLEMFLKSISQQLRVLRLTVFGNATYLDADRWKKLTKRHMPKLSKLYFDYESDFDEQYSACVDHHMLFWFCIEKNWSCEYRLRSYDYVLSIRPRRYC